MTNSVNNISPSARVCVAVWMANARLSKKLDAGLGAIHGIGLTEFLVLTQLAAVPGGRMRRIDLADSLGRSASGVTRLLRPMEKIGLVQRESSERDARVSFVALTETGTIVLRDATLSFEQQCQQLCQGLKADAFPDVEAGMQQLAST